MTELELKHYYRNHPSKAQRIDTLIARLIMGFFILTIGLECVR